MTNTPAYKANRSFKQLKWDTSTGKEVRFLPTEKQVVFNDHRIPKESKAECPMCASGHEPSYSQVLFIITPNRLHKPKRWDRTRKYHLRIQKKWEKRFGLTTHSLRVNLPKEVKEAMDKMPTKILATKIDRDPMRILSNLTEGVSPVVSMGAYLKSAAEGDTPEYKR